MAKNWTNNVAISSHCWHRSRHIRFLAETFTSEGKNFYFRISSLSLFSFSYFLKTFLYSFISLTLKSFSIISLSCVFFYQKNVFKNGPNPGLFFIYFHLFKHTLQFLKQINVKTCPSSIQCRDSNSQLWNMILLA